MILTCPACASRYFLEDAKLPPQGRKVRCSACSRSWRAESYPDLPTEPAPFAFESLGPKAQTPAAPAQADTAPAAEPEPPTEPCGLDPAPLPKAYRQKVQAQRRVRRAVAAGVVWAGLAAACLLLVASAVVFRVQIVTLWPRTAGAYAAVKLPVNPLGLAPDNIQAGQGLRDGRLALIVTGGERNIQTRPRLPATLRISLYDREGARLLTRLFHPPAAPIAPGESRPFALSVPDPPIAGVQVGVDFLFEPRRGATLVRAGVDRAAPHLRGLIQPVLPNEGRPRLARSIPRDSPYALPPTAQAE